MAQAEIKDIYKRVEEFDFDLVKDIGDFLFLKWKKWHKYPDNLILRVRGLGDNYLRKKKNSNLLRKYLETDLDYTDPDNNVFENERQEEKFLEDKKWYENMMERSHQYTRYIIKRKAVREERKKYVIYRPEPITQPKKLQERSNLEF